MCRRVGGTARCAAASRGRLERTCRTRRRPRRRRFRPRRCSGSSARWMTTPRRTPRGPPGRRRPRPREPRGTSSRATLLVQKSKIAMLPPLVPAARRVPLRLNATHVALPCCRDSSMISSMSLPGTPSAGSRNGDRGKGRSAGCQLILILGANDLGQDAGNARPRTATGSSCGRKRQGSKLLGVYSPSIVRFIFVATPPRQRGPTAAAPESGRKPFWL